MRRQWATRAKQHSTSSGPLVCRLTIHSAVFISPQPLLGVLVLGPMLAVGVLLVGFNRRVKPVYQAARATVGG